VSPEAALAGANALALIGADGEVEIVTAAQADLVGAQRFRLSGFVRGLGGSEAAASRHLPPGARVVVLDGSATTLTSDLADIGRERRYRIGPARHDVGDPTMVELALTPQGEALLPFSPVRPKARRGTAGILLSWIRRTRIDGDSWDLVEVPLGEESERYAIRLLSGGVPVRTEIVNAPAWLYPSAVELVDFGAPQAELSLSLAQISATLGAGREWRGRIAVD
jgi:hypothetical protein